jgi:hypothetical protein
MIGDSEEVLSFLLRWKPDGPWVLTAIHPFSNSIITRTFSRGDDQLLKSWVSDLNGKFNLYFTINSTAKNFDSKPRRIDIVSIDTLHIDCDPRAGEDIDKEQERILKRLSEFTPKPSSIVFSGGGYQAYWLLEDPILLDGTEATAIEAESYSVQLELLLGADRVSNCDRIMRLPGSVNLPNEGKLKKGRKPALARLIEWTGEKYPLSLFAKAPVKIQQKGLSPEHLPGEANKIKISGNIPPVYVDDLAEKKIIIPDHVKVLIVQGCNPDNLMQYPSRSEALWAVVCELVRAKADDDTIAGVIMNRDNKISESVLDKPRPERYVAKQINDAKEEVSDPVLRELNSRHAVISDIGGKCRIISEVEDHTLGRSKISYQSFPDFFNRYCNRKVQIAVDGDGKPIMKPIGKWWTEHPQRRQYETVIFSPGKDVSSAYNLWQGFACDSIPGDVSIFFDHILNNISRGVEEHNRYILSWMARAVQEPDRTGEVAIVLRGEMGTGKGAFAKHFGSLFGRHFLQVSDPKHLIGSFNSHLRDSVVLFADEAFFAGDKKHESVLKALVTESTLTIEAKGIDVTSSPNYTHIIMSSNGQWVVPAGSNERRFFVLDVGIDKMQNKRYFSDMQKQMNEGGREALLHFLLNYDISNFEVRDVPKTAALQDQKLLSMGNEDSWWHEKLEEGRVLKEHDNWEREVQKNGLQDDYIMFMQRIGIMRKASPTVLGKFLGRVCPGGTPKSYQRMAKVKITNNYGEEFQMMRRVYFYQLPELESCRDFWDKNHGGSGGWPAPMDAQKELEEPDALNAFK